ncbi:hypothetical protein ACFPER_05060 [Agromyces aurantiacus]|uniref:DUF2993 domain-containing protein n=1 Tax=Agromyces aurantiacus TaxID=165814 RepID=A0ABV9R3S2_9MICO|nr:hypothetical protein [Agromyces aurantiacus]MBM7502829.1 hypothetical protein [Agromyces aurantiacus]
MGSSGRRGGRLSPLAIAGWTGLAVLLAAAFLAALGGLNQTLYGSSAFIERYLGNIARDDIVSAAATPGVRLDDDELAALGLTEDVSTALLRSGVVESGPEDVRIVSDVAHDDGSHTVTASYRLESSIVETAFDVRPIEPLYGLLHRWEFATSPLAVIQATAAHNPLFTVGSLTLDSRATKTGDALTAFSQQASYLAIAPAVYEFGYQSTLLEAVPATVVAEPGATVPVTIDALPTEAFVERVQTKVDEYLTEQCATQAVLQPAGCPFGVAIDDRIVGDPKWTIVSSPEVTLVPGDSSFEMPATPGVARITVDVQSLFDGSFSTLEQDEGFTLALEATVRPDGSISIQLR